MEREKGQAKIERDDLSGSSTINDRRSARDGIPLLNVASLAGIFPASPHVMKRIRGVPSGCVLLKKATYWIPDDKS
jgi:hypothetical protein